MNQRIPLPTVNAGSMADIAFLLLIFFLVTTSIDTDAGILKKVPRSSDEIVDIAERNLLRIQLNAQGDILIDEVITPIAEVQANAIAFLDNGGIPKGVEGHCEYCQGKASKEASDNPQKAIISITTHRETAYSDFIAVQNEVLSAYETLRDREARRLFDSGLKAMVLGLKDGNTPDGRKGRFKAQLTTLRERFPKKIVEALLSKS